MKAKKKNGSIVFGMQVEREQHARDLKFLINKMEESGLVVITPDCTLLELVSMYVKNIGGVTPHSNFTYTDLEETIEYIIHLGLLSATLEDAKLLIAETLTEL